MTKMKKKQGDSTETLPHHPVKFGGLTLQGWGIQTKVHLSILKAVMTIYRKPEVMRSTCNPHRALSGGG
jgi:hypothetical protein